MNRNWIQGLGVAIAVMLAIVVIDSVPRRSSDGQMEQYMLPGLHTELGKVEKIVLVGRETTSTLQLNDGKWTVAERYQLEAKFEKLASLLKTLADSKLKERKTRKPENFDVLGVNAEEATEIKVVTPDGRYSVLAGNSDQKRKGQYVRLFEGEAVANQVWLTDQVVDISSSPADWLEDEIIDVEADRIQEISYTQEQEVLGVVRQDGQLKISDLPADAELRYSSVVDTLGRALSNVRMQDVLPAAEIDFSGAGYARFRLEDDLEIKIQLVERAGKYWIQLLDHAKSEWAYEVNRIAYENLTKRLGDLLKQESEE